MSDLDDFLTPTLARQVEAEQALINGDPGLRLAMWSTQEPVTVFGAERTVIGSDEARQVFRWLATRFSNLTDYRFELVAAGASGDLAYTVGYEHITVSMDGGPVAPLTLRVTHLYRREDGEWKIVHRHADAPRPVPSVPPTHRRSRQQGQRDQLQVDHLRVNQHPRPGTLDRCCHRRQSTKPPEEAVVIVAAYRLADLTCPGVTAGQGCGGWVSCSAWRAAMVAGSSWLPAGTASARRSKYRSKPAGASTSTNRATVSLGLAKVWAIPWGIRAKLPAGAVSCRCSTVSTTVPSRT